MICIEMAFLPTDFLFQTHLEDHPPYTSHTGLPSCTPQDFHGVIPVLMKRSMSFSGVDGCEEVHGDDDFSDDGSQAGEKKRRLNLEQVKTLEKNFELGNKLEPERKMQLARTLGLQPRQIAIWFQNRRARWKTKQLEKDYDLLKRQFEAVKADNDALQAQNKKLHAELLALKSREPKGVGPINLNKENDQISWSNGSENSSGINLDISRTTLINSPVSSQLSSKQFFPSSLRPASITQLLQGSPRSDIHCQKIDQIVQDESFCNIFSGISDQSGLWAWPEQDHFHQNQA
ncbi:hypothetical protein AAG906_023053 [Vitis piasezkii]